ncbi:hypothetical protein BJY01DRAFT_202594 [Aspergillus pseudoustus]|uniref:FAD-binding PCMH-type domain-containing protein n=1 Tax=Aspergillus pseudoustus TaxID=1810923 RepID=A0ABR4KZN3_9EURO
MGESQVVSLGVTPSTFRGETHRAGDEGYAEARLIFNMRHDSWQPALIARPVDVPDLQALMRHAYAHDIPVAVRSGGHGVDSTAMPHGQLVVDLSAWKDIHVDTASRVIRLGAGVLLGEMDAACEKHGLVVPAGTVSHTGVAGLTLGGGLGYNMRRFGATVDQLLACEVVTTDGRFIRASGKENTDLFWALRGGGGNFGIVTSFEFQGHEMGHTPSYAVILFELEDAKSILGKLPAFVKTSPRELIVVPTIMGVPPFPGIPPEQCGVRKLVTICVFTGNPDKFDLLLKEVTGLGKPSAVTACQAPWTQVNSMLDLGAPFGRRYSTRGGYLSQITDDLVDTVLQGAEAAPSEEEAADAHCAQLIWLFGGGALTEDHDEDSVAFSRKGAIALIECTTQWDSPGTDAKVLAWIDNLTDSLKPFLLPNGYVNLCEDLGQEWLQGLYGSPEKYSRLLAMKQKWDPKNLLRFNKNFVV